MLTTLLINLTPEIEFFSFFSLFFPRTLIFHKKATSFFQIAKLFAAIICIALVCTYWNSHSWRIIPLNLILCIFFLWGHFQIPWKYALLWGLGGMLILNIIEATFYSLISFLTLSSQLKIILSGFMTILLIWSIYIPLHIKTIYIHLPESKKIWLLLDLLLLILTMMTTYFLHIVESSFFASQELFRAKLLISAGGMGITITLFLLIYYYDLFLRNKKSRQIQAWQLHEQRKYYQAMLQREKDTRKFRHDISNDLMQIASFCDHEQYDRLREYLQETFEGIQSIRESTFETGNDILNTILNFYLVPLKETYSITIRGYLSNEIAIEEHDFCIVCANLIKNAAEAIIKIPQGKIIIAVQEGTQFLSLKIQNNFDGHPHISMNTLLSTKRQDLVNHGIGLRNVQEIVQKHHGTFHWAIQDNMFFVQVSLAKNLSPKKSENNQDQN